MSLQSYSLLGTIQVGEMYKKNQELCELLPIVKTLKNANSENFRRIKNLSISKTF